MKGVPKTLEHKINDSKSNNTSGYFRVTKMNAKTCKQGFIWKYQYLEDGKKKSITAITIEKLKKKVKAKGLKWIKF